MERWQAEMSMGSLREAENDDLDLSPLARWRSTVLCIMRSEPRRGVRICSIPYHARVRVSTVRPAH
jgi:hypothetical protein